MNMKCRGKPRFQSFLVKEYTRDVSPNLFNPDLDPDLRILPKKYLK
jgi:hypothetical protein